MSSNTAFVRGHASANRPEAGAPLVTRPLVEISVPSKNPVMFAPLAMRRTVYKRPVVIAIGGDQERPVPDASLVTRVSGRSADHLRSQFPDEFQIALRADPEDTAINLGPVELPPMGISLLDGANLIVYPFSTLGAGVGRGLGPAAGMAITILPCGGQGERCCQNDPCDGGNVCRFGECQETCGDLGQNCCRGDQCTQVDGETRWCDVSPEPNKCRACGGENDTCCPRNFTFPCLGDLTCMPDNKCRTCGADFTECCEGNSCPDSQYSCRDGECRPPDPTDPTAKECDGPEIRVGANEGGTFRVNLRRNEGRTVFTVNTLFVPDRVKVFYEGVEVTRLPCVGTAYLDDTCHLLKEEGQIISNALFCCYEGRCDQTLMFGPGASTFVDVVVEPNCAGTPDTAWGFSFSCATPSP